MFSLIQGVQNSLYLSCPTHHILTKPCHRIDVVELLTRLWHVSLTVIVYNTWDVDWSYVKASTWTNRIMVLYVGVSLPCAPYRCRGRARVDEKYPKTPHHIRGGNHHRSNRPHHFPQIACVAAVKPSPPPHRTHSSPAPHFPPFVRSFL